MRVLIVEDEAVIARRLARLTREILGKQLDRLLEATSLQAGLATLEQSPVDLVLLDLSLHGEDGFSLLEHAVAGSFHTIIISAHTDRALRAFEYGVLDFVPKPFDKERLAAALARFQQADARADYGTRYLGVAKHGKVELVPLARVAYIKGAGAYAELVLDDGTSELHGKSLDRLMMILPPVFERIHKSYIVPMDKAARLLVHEGSRYELVMREGTVLPVGRTRARQIRRKLEG